MSIDTGTSGAGDVRTALDRDYHDAIAAEYDAVVVTPRRWMNDRLFAPVLRGVRGERALDLGCGTGHMSLRLAPRVRQVLALDHSAGMLAAAANNARRAGARHIVFRRGDVLDDIAQLRERFDVVTAVGFLHHLTPAQTQALLHRCRSLLQPRGSLIVAEPFAVAEAEPDDIAAWNRASPLVRRGYSVHAEDPDEAPLDEAAFRALLAAAGFDVAAEQRCWDILSHSARLGFAERWKLRQLWSRHRGRGNVIALRLVKSAA